MVRFYNAAFMAAWGEFNRAIGVIGGPSNTEEFLDELKKAWAGLVEEVARAKLPISFGTRDHLRLLKAHLDATPADVTAVLLEARAVHNGLLGDLAEHAFVRIRPDRKQLYAQHEPLFGSKVAAKFPDSARDIAAASRCLALEEWTACVFHLMRALEQPLHVLANKLGVVFPNPVDFQNWKTIIDKIDAEIASEVKRLEQTAASHQRAETLRVYAEAALQLRHFKNAWRNDAMHAREHYDEREATRVYGAVKEFMLMMAGLIDYPSADRESSP